MISIIIPLYNKQEAIERCIQSVIQQTYTDWELIIVDDGSTDSSAVKVQPFLGDSRINYIYKENGGVSSARNLGMVKAKGEWIIYMDADDYFLSKALITLLNIVKKYNVKIGVGNFLIERGEVKKKACQGIEGIIKDNFRAWYFMKCFPRAGTAIFHSSIIRDHLFDETLTRYEDAKYLLSILRKHQIAYTPQCVMVYSLENLGLSKPLKDVFKDYIFSMDFRKKSFWEKIILARLLNQGFNLYRDHRKILYQKYLLFLPYCIVERLLAIIVRFINKILMSNVFRKLNFKE